MLPQRIEDTKSKVLDSAAEGTTDSTVVTEVPGLNLGPNTGCFTP